MPYLFYKQDRKPQKVLVPIPAGMTLEFWRPKLWRPLPGGFPPHPFLLFYLLHFLGIFTSRNYGIVIIRKDGQELHHTALVPAYFRFPFMKPNDLQIMCVWTKEDCRGTGVGFLGLQEAMKWVQDPDLTFWYMVMDTNTLSIRLAEKAGFQYSGRASKAPLPGLGRLKINLLGIYLNNEN